jgi:NTE family protein
LRDLPAAAFLRKISCVTTMDIVELVYRPTEPQGETKDYEFSRTTMQNRWEQGRADAQATLEASPWLAPIPPEIGARTFDVPLELLRKAKAKAAAESAAAGGASGAAPAAS